MFIDNILPLMSKSWTIIPGAIAQVKDQVKKDCQVMLDEDTFLPNDW